MITINHECYVDFEVAKLLKEAGFDWKCSSLYKSDGEFKHLLYDTIDWDYGEVDWNNVTCEKTSYMGIKGWEGGCSAPTLEVAQRWLREVKDIHLFVRPFSLDKHTYVVTVVVDDSTWGQVNDSNGRAIIFDSYEEAQEAGIKKALEIILEKG